MCRGGYSFRIQNRMVAIILPGQLFVQYHAPAWPRESRGNDEPAIVGGIIVARWRGVFQPFSAFAEASPRLAAARSTGSTASLWVCRPLMRALNSLPCAEIIAHGRGRKISETGMQSCETQYITTSGLVAAERVKAGGHAAPLCLPSTPWGRRPKRGPPRSNPHRFTLLLRKFLALIISALGSRENCGKFSLQPELLTGHRI